MKYNEEEIALIWLDSFLDLTYKTKLQMVKSVKEPKELKEKFHLFKDLIVSDGGEELYLLMQRSNTERYTEYILGALKRRNLEIITVYSKDYPESLKVIDLPPLVLYCCGNVNLLKEKNKFGIVGSRKTLPDTLKRCENVSKEIAESGFVVVTGMAQGADAKAIEGALDSGNVISVIASGIDDIYPEQNRYLVDKVASVGLVLGEHNPGIKSKPYLFPIRNRIISALSRGVLIVSGSKKSGTSYTANFALDYGKDVFAFPYGLGVESGEGCNELIKNGANLVTGTEDILSFYGVESKTVKEETEADDEETSIYDIIKEEPVHIEKLAQKAGKSVVEITPVLLMLEIKGKVVKDAGNVYSAL